MPERSLINKKKAALIAQGRPIRAKKKGLKSISAIFCYSTISAGSSSLNKAMSRTFFCTAIEANKLIR